MVRSLHSRLVALALAVLFTAPLALAQTKIVVWGENSLEHTEPSSVYTDIDAGFSHNLALAADSLVSAWGNDDFGQATVPRGLGNVIDVAAGFAHSLALKSDGTVVAWGWGANGQTLVPVWVTGATAVAAGNLHSYALTSIGVVGWGDNTFGQLNFPNTAGATAMASGAFHGLAVLGNTTVAAWGLNNSGQVTVPDGLSGVTAVAAGVSHSLALKSDGTVVAWGDNTYGQTAVPRGLTGVTAIAAGEYHSMARLSDGSVVAWGWSDHGQTDVPYGLTDGVLLAGGGLHSLTIRADGSIVGWGESSENRTAPPREITKLFAGPIPSFYGFSVMGVRRDGSSAIFLIDNQPSLPDVSFDNVKDISVGAVHSLVLYEDGTVGAIDYTDITTNTDWGQADVPPGITDAIAVEATNYGSLILRSDGTVVSFGDPMDVARLIPSDLSGVTALSTGGRHGLALKEDGTVVAWGRNEHGESSVPEGLNGVVAISTGYRHSVALKEDGTVIAWGNNDHGQTNVPAGLSGVTAVAAMNLHTLALKDDGTIVGWGLNHDGQAGDPGGLGRVVAIGTGDFGFNSFALTHETALTAIAPALTITGAEGWRTLALPRANLTLGGRGPGFLTNMWTAGYKGADRDQNNRRNSATVILYDEPTGAYAPPPKEDAIAPGQGMWVYVVADDDDRTPGVQGGFPKTLSTEGGTPISGAFDFDLTYTPDAPLAGFNLIGNPYDEAIVWGPTGWVPHNVNYIVNVWDPGYNGGAFRSWNGLAGALTGGVIPAGQGFHVQTFGPAPTLRVEESAKMGVAGQINGLVPTGSPGTAGKSTASEAHGLTFRLSGTVGESARITETFVTLSDDAALGLDARDGRHLAGASGDALRLYTLAPGGEALAIAALPSDAKGQVELPLHAEALSSGDAADARATLAWDAAALPVGWSATLKDRQTGQSHDLTEAGQVALRLDARSALTVTAADRVEAAKTQDPLASPPVPQIRPLYVATYKTAEARFTLVLTPDAFASPAALAAEIGEVGPNPTRGSAALAVTVGEAGEVAVRVYDALGRLVGERRQPLVAGTHRLAVPVSGLAPGAYVVRVEAPGGAETRRLTVVR